MADARALAVDIGGTKLAAAIVDAEGTVHRRAQAPTPKADPQDTEPVARALLRLMREVVADERETLRAIGLASAGPLDLTAGTASPVNIDSWRDFPIRETVAAAFPQAEVVLVGDAVAAAVGEHWRGAGVGADAMLGIVVSTGIGGGLILDGHPYTGRTGNAGHIGHVPTNFDTTPCACGATGCVEAVASGPSMTRWAKANGWRPKESKPAPARASAQASAEAHEPEPADAKALAADARAGVPIALAAFDRAAEALACGLISAAALVDLDLAVIGGGVAAAGPILLDPLRFHLAQRAGLAFVRRMRIVPGELGRDAGLVGAARCAFLSVTHTTDPNPHNPNPNTDTAPEPALA